MPNFNKYSRNIQYTKLDFAESRQALINYAKTYFPNQLTDFNESNPATMMLEMSAYVSDVLGFYANVNLQESLAVTADERINLYNIGQSQGYKPKTIYPSNVELDIYQLVPSIGEGNNTKPDFRYALYINANMQVSTTDLTPINFRTVDAVDFRFSSSYDPTTITIHTVTQDGSIDYYLLKKKVRAISGELFTDTFEFTEPKVYDKIVIENENVVEIVDIVDVDGNVWYEVPFLAQDIVPVAVRNTPYNNPKLAAYRSSVPYLLCYKQTEFRYVTRLRKDNFTEIQFGAGLSSESDEEIVPNPMNVGLGLPYFERVTDLSIDPSNFLFTRTYGSTPRDTTLTVRYSTAKGLSDNVNANTITAIVSSDIVDPNDSTDPVVLQTIKDSLSVNNPFPAWGGNARKPIDNVRQEIMANFAAQNRSVTREDYLLRVYTMPAKYGAVAKAYVVQDVQLGNMIGNIPNPYSLNLYILSYDENRNFVACNEAMKENIRSYMSQYRLMTDAISIRDPYIINLGVNIDITTSPDSNSNEVVLKCLEKAIDFFDNSKMGINQPIILSKLRSLLDDVDQVESVISIDLENLVDRNSGYSGNVFPIKDAIRNGIVYPSVSPSIFEIKYLKRDIKIRVVEN